MDVLNDADVLKMHANTRWDSWYEVQRYNIIVLLYSLGQRQESLKLLRVGNFHDAVSDDGEKLLKVAFRKMKNLQGGIRRRHKQYIMAHEDERL